MISSNNLNRYRSGQYLTLGGTGVGMEIILKKDFFLLLYLNTPFKKKTLNHLLKHESVWI